MIDEIKISLEIKNSIKLYLGNFIFLTKSNFLKDIKVSLLELTLILLI